MNHPPLALIGSGEFLPTMAEVDRILLGATGKERPRVAILPTAAGAEKPTEWTEMGCAHFARLGAEPLAVMAVDRASCEDEAWAEAVRGADVIYFSGGQPHYLLEAIGGSAVWKAVRERHEAGAVLVGSSGGAMFLAERSFGFPDGFEPENRPRTMKLYNGMGLLPGFIIMPHYDAIPPDVMPEVQALVPTGLRLLGIDEDTALLRLDARWSVAGKGNVWFLRDGQIENAFASGADLPRGLL